MEDKKYSLGGHSSHHKVSRFNSKHALISRKWRPNYGHSFGFREGIHAVSTAVLRHSMSEGTNSGQIVRDCREGMSKQERDISDLGTGLRPLLPS
jgi:hypothetical protein